VIGFIDPFAFMHAIAVARQGHDIAQLASQRHQPVGVRVKRRGPMAKMGRDQGSFGQAMRLGQIAGAQFGVVGAQGADFGSIRPGRIVHDFLRAFGVGRVWRKLVRRGIAKILDKNTLLIYPLIPDKSSQKFCVPA